jgi:hypothetical protein
MGVGEMNAGWVRFHLEEASEELTRTVAAFETGEGVDEEELRVALGHIYNHLNTAWNSRAMDDERLAVQSDQDFFTWRAFPTDISMG